MLKASSVLTLVAVHAPIISTGTRPFNQSQRYSRTYSIYYNKRSHIGTLFRPTTLRAPYFPLSRLIWNPSNLICNLLPISAILRNRTTSRRRRWGSWISILHDITSNGLEGLHQRCGLQNLDALCQTSLNLTTQQFRVQCVVLHRFSTTDQIVREMYSETHCLKS